MTAQEAGFSVTNTTFDYRAAGKRCHNMTRDMADDCFESLAKQYGVCDRPYGSWNMFWMGYLGE